MYSGDLETAIAYLALNSHLTTDLATAFKQIALIFPEQYPLIAAGFVNNLTLSERLPPGVYIANLVFTTPAFALIPLQDITFTPFELETFLNIQWQ